MKRRLFTSIGVAIALGYVLLVVWSQINMVDYLLGLQADQFAGLPF